VSAKSPLAIGCKASTCTKPDVSTGERRHAFHSPTGTLPGLGGACMACGDQGLVDWELCHHMRPADFGLVKGELRKELIRDNYWGLTLPEHILRKARKRTRDQLEVSTGLVLRRALVVNHPLEGVQTPWATTASATIVQCAQHGTGTCCRACVEKWFGFPLHVPLSDDVLGLLSRFAMLYIDERLAEAGLPGGLVTAETA
jgi:hypothetical protein